MPTLNCAVVIQIYAHTITNRSLPCGRAWQAVTQLLAHFEAYKDIPKISELRGKVGTLKETLKSHVFSDFST